MPTKFDFVSPGIELREIDQSSVSPVPEQDGILLIGRAKKGPAMKPIKITSLSNFHDVFGTPMDGVKRTDPWREGNTGAGSWAGYSAEAYLAAGVGPVKFIRLAGEEENPGDAGWSVTQANFNGGAIPAVADVKGALGIFVSDNPAGAGAMNAVLGAIVYADGIQLGLNGDARDPLIVAPQTNVSAYAIKKGSAGWGLTIDDGSDTEAFTFNFDPNSPNFIRNVLSTDPTKFSTGVGTYNFKYFLGESFERNVARLDGANGLCAFVMALDPTVVSDTLCDHKLKLQASKSGWFIASNASSGKKLFRLAALDEGGDFAKNYVVRVKDLREASTVKPNATFSIEIARVGAGPSEYVEKYSNLTLNPDDINYIAKRIGTVNQTWDATKGKVVTTGIYDNVSDLVRIEMASSVNKSDLPVGFVGPKNPLADQTITEASAARNASWIYGLDATPNGQGVRLLEGLRLTDSITTAWPTYGLSTTNTYLRGANYPSTSLFGLSYLAQKGEGDFADLSFRKADYDPHLAEGDANSNASYVFTLNDIVTATGLYYFNPASAGADITTLINAGVKQFVAPFFGGTNGENILLENPFNETAIASGYAKYSLESALSIVADRDMIRYDLIAMPGITSRARNQDLINQTAARGDALAIVDIAGIDQSAEDTGTAATAGAINSVVAEINTAGFDSSYAATYYPNVRLSDVSNGNGSILMAPPSVAAIGAIAKSEADSQPWFAPAGFNRGGLNPLGGQGGPAVVGTLEHLTKADRDKLYEVNVNPIARFPATGDTVIFGQKTLQQSASALDRINVRRMMIFLKKRIGDISDTILFEQSTKATFDKFKSRVEPILSEVRSQFGITEYKLVLDETTTTPDLQDRNIMYAKIFVKPAKAIEFIAIDFVITQSGVEF